MSEFDALPPASSEAAAKEAQAKDSAVKKAPADGIAVAEQAPPSGLAKLAQGAAATFGLRIYGAALQYLTQLYFARSIGAEQMGIFAFAWTCSTILAFLTPLGFDTSIVRFIPTEVDRSNWSKVRGLLSLAHRYTLRTSGLAAFFAAIVIFGFDGKLESPYAIPAIVAIALIPVLALLNLYQGIARCFHWVAQVAGPAYFIRPTLFLGFAALAIEVFDHRTGVFMVYAAAAACVVTLAMQYVRYRQRLAPEIRDAEPDTKDHRLWLRTSIPMVLVASFELMLANTDILMMGLIRGPSETGVYNIAVRTASCLLFVLFAVTAFAQPRIASLFAQRKHEELLRFARQMRWWIFAPSALGAVLLYVFGKHFFAFFDSDGREFVLAYSPAVVLTIGILIRSLAGPVDSVLTMTGRERSLAAGLAFATAINLLGNAILIPHFGGVGAACATAMSVTLEVCLISHLAGKHIGFVPFLLTARSSRPPHFTMSLTASGAASAAAPTDSKRTNTTTRQEPSYHFELVRDLAGIDALEDEWLAFEAQFATRDQFFQTWLWNRSWWQCFGNQKGIELRIVVARENVERENTDGQAAGPIALILPMVEVRRGPLRVLEPTGGLLSCFGDALVADTPRHASVLAQAWNFLESVASASAIHFPAVHERSKLAGLLQEKQGSLIEENASPEIAIDGFENIDGYLASRSKRFRKDVRRARKKLRALGDLESSASDSEISISQSVARMLEFKRDWIRANGLPARTVVSPRGEAFIAEYCTQLAQRGGDKSIVDLDLSTLRVDDRLIACGLAFVFRGTQLEYLGGFDHEFRQHGPGKVQLADSIERAILRGAVSCNLLTPRTSFKEHWTDDAPRVRQHFVATSWKGKLYRRLYLKSARPALKYLYNATIPPLKRYFS